MSNLHSELPNDQLHVAKGQSEAANGQFMWRDEKGGQRWDYSVILPQALSIVSSYSAPPTENYNDIYLLDGTANHADWDGIATDSWARYDGTIWYGIQPSEGYWCYNKSTNEYNIYDGTSWSSYTTGGVYKKYVALLDQASTNPPSIFSELENNTGQVPSRAYHGVGVYSLIFSSLFTDNTKVSVKIPNGIMGTVSAYMSGSSTITIETRDFTGAASNGVLTRTPITIEIYR